MKKKCLYCDNLTNIPHFKSECCGRGMCDECYNNLRGTDEQIQLSYSDLDDEQYEKLERNGLAKADYVCFDCFDKMN